MSTHTAAFPLSVLEKAVAHYGDPDDDGAEDIRDILTNGRPADARWLLIETTSDGATWFTSWPSADLAARAAGRALTNQEDRSWQPQAMVDLFTGNILAVNVECRPGPYCDSFGEATLTTDRLPLSEIEGIRACDGMGR